MQSDRNDNGTEEVYPATRGSSSLSGETSPLNPGGGAMYMSATSRRESCRFVTQSQNRMNINDHASRKSVALGRHKGILLEPDVHLGSISCIGTF